MTLDELKKQKIVAMKARDNDAVTAYNALISKLMLMATDPNHGKDITDADIVTAARKTESELVEERANFEKAGRAETVASLDKQIETVKQYIPAMMSEEKIKEIILSLDDKSLPAVMKHFKTNYAGKVDMKLVNETVRKL
ncbi:MAG: GatB/YqeY domain-containing protein [Clostridia bacterium]|nr:GatB/YqeY domain-containing protein [Clostridia bacterium]